MRILGCDPGLAHTALVLMVDQMIIQGWTLKSPADGPTPKFETAVERSKDIGSGLANIYDEIGQVDHVAAEAYRDIPGNLRQARNRWTTPLTIGILIPYLELFLPEGVEIHWQDPEIVMRTYKNVVGFQPGAGLLTNDHLRAAGAHALCLHDRLRIEKRTHAPVTVRP